ncbi:MAG: hypothetical protein RBU21_19840 [FCB group bacterium]|jgi:bifunctional DNA-binding transcriptional regulator/antitoxin component of YhaV-PrlF toxin-antitoxin module|nr:hypothetical protein [FCB group bacterium]
MGHPTKIQLINRKSSQQWYVNIPHAVAEALELDRGEIWEWIIEDKDQMVLRRQIPSDSPIKKKRHNTMED